ncbi:MAG: replication initiation protein [Bacteroidota bacterium]
MRPKIQRVDISTLPKTVQQPYVITEKFDFNIHEARILIRVLQQIKKHQFIQMGTQIDMDNNVVMRFRPKDLTVGNDLKLVYNALGTIRKKEIVVKGTTTDEGQEVETRTITGIINEATYSTNNSFVDIKINADWYTILVDLSKGYTPYLGNVGFQTGNKHHLVIYQYICQWHDEGVIDGKTLTEAQVRKDFKIFDLYKDFRKVIDRVIEPCKQELDEFADRSFNYTPIRANPNATRGRGAKIVAISFKFYKTSTEDINSTYEPKRAAKKISEFKSIYGFDETQEQQLGGLAKRYDLSFLSALEYENRPYLLKQENFIEAFHKIIIERSAAKK